MAKLKDLLGEVFDETPKVDKHQVIEGVRNFGIVGKTLYNNSNIMEVAKQLSEIAESAHHHILGEEADWFDKISVNKNMGSLKGMVKEFKKTANEANSVNQRLTSLYEDMGHILNRYYEINEDAGDMDKDGKDEPDSEEYMDNKDKAIKKAMSKEAVGDSNNMDQVDRPDAPKKDARDDENESLDPDNSDQVDQPDDPAKDGEEMKEIKRSLQKRNGYVDIPALGGIARRFK